MSSTQLLLNNRHNTPSKFVTISGDCNNALLFATLSTFQKFVSCSIRASKILDLFHANLKDSSISKANKMTNVCVFACNVSPLFRGNEKNFKKEVMGSWRSPVGLFWGYWLGCTVPATWRGQHHDWMCVYLKFCLDNTLPTRTVRWFPNNKHYDKQYGILFPQVL